MSEPLRTAYSREEITRAAQAWIVATYGRQADCADAAERDRWDTRFGLLLSFLYDHFPATPPTPEATDGH